LGERGRYGVDGEDRSEMEEDMLLERYEKLVEWSFAMDVHENEL
jgi:hypothetical protein